MGRERIEAESRFARWWASASCDWFMLGFLAGGLWTAGVVFLVTHG